MRYLIFVLGSLFSVTLNAQYYFYDEQYYDRSWVLEAGIAGGYMNCLTDLGGRSGRGGNFLKDLEAGNGHRSFAVSLTAFYRGIIALRVQALSGTVSAADSTLSSSDPLNPRFIRNLHFSSKIREVQLLSELHLLRLISPQQRGKFSPYMLAGIGIFHFDPTAVYQNQPYRLQSLRTEGQGFPGETSSPYALVQVNFSAGGGFCYEINALLSFAIEANYRYLQTDFLDDVSGRYIDHRKFAENLKEPVSGIAVALADRRLDQTRLTANSIRGNPENKDGYFTVSTTLRIALNRKKIR